LVDREVWVTREQFEHAAYPALMRTVELAAAVLAAGDMTVADLAEILLVGGSAQVPLLAELIERELGVRPRLSDEPELYVAEGALAVVDRLDARPLTAADAPTVVLPSDEVTSEAVHPIVAGPDVEAETLPDAPVLDPVPTARPRQAATGQGDGQRRDGAKRVRVLLSRRSGRLAVGIVAALALVLLVAAQMTSWQRNDVAAPSRTSAAPTNRSPSAPAGVDDDGLTTVAPSTPAARAVASMASTLPATAPTGSLPVSTGPPPPVTVVVTAAPLAGMCDTDFTFTAQFTVSERGRYRWHWVFGGPGGYGSASGDHDVDKNSAVRMNKKFNENLSGTYWAQVQITSPISATSDPATVDVVCTR
jgi:hypothetical protein